MTGNIILILQFIVGMSIIVGLHELGHLLMAKMFGMRVESYGIGMPPKVLSKKIGETEYYLGAVPFGGAVLISGMIEEFDEESEEVKTPQPWDFSSKPAWQRLLVILGGIIFNFISSILIFSGIASYVGEEVLTKNQLNENGIAPTEIGRSLGLEDGDKILEINGKLTVKQISFFLRIFLIPPNMKSLFQEILKILNCLGMLVQK
jgi:regulator of sigma E protease